MERKPINELTKLKVQNANLSLQILQMQANQIVAERDKVLLAEFHRLRCTFDDWQLDEATWELIIKKKNEGD